MSLLPTIDLRRLAGRVLTGAPHSSSDAPAPGVTQPTAPVPASSVVDTGASVRQVLRGLVDAQTFDNVFLSSLEAADESLIEACSGSEHVRRVFLWVPNPYPFSFSVTSNEGAARERSYPDWWSEKIEWLPEDIEAVPRVVDLLITDHSPWTLRFAQPRCCLLTGDAARAPRDEDYRWTEGDGWLLGHRCRPRSRQAMNYRTIYSMNGGAENEDPFGWF